VIESLLHAPLQRTFHPLGFALRIETNSGAVLDAAAEEWEAWARGHDASPIVIRIEVRPGNPQRPCPPRFHADGHVFTVASDSENSAHADTRAQTASAILTESAVADRAWFQYHFLDALAFQLITSAHLTPIHAACIARNGEATLLAGNSHAGKSSTAYASARRGWTYVSDDSSPLLRRCAAERLVLGAPHYVRLRPDAPALFPELAAHRPVMRGNGKMVLQIPTELLGLSTSLTGRVRRFILLNRREGPARLTPVDPSLVREHCSQHFYRWDPPIAAEQRAAFDTMLKGVETLALEYSDLDGAIDLLER